MKLLKKLYRAVKYRIDDLPSLSLCHPKIKIEEETCKPYFVISHLFNSHGAATEKLYVDELKAKLQIYKKSFSRGDWEIIQYNLGGLESLQLYGTYQIINFDYENMLITVMNRATMKRELWNIAKTITNKKYLDLDKQSILEFGIFYQKIKTSDIIQAKIKQQVEKQVLHALYLEDIEELGPKLQASHLRLIK